jgi:hypothetical protein
LREGVDVGLVGGGDFALCEGKVLEGLGLIVIPYGLKLIDFISVSGRGEGHLGYFLYQALELFDFLIFGEDDFFEGLELLEDHGLHPAEGADLGLERFPEEIFVTTRLVGIVAEGAIALEGELARIIMDNHVR